MAGSGRDTVVKGSSRLSKSIGAGIGAIASGGRDFFILEHKTNSKNFSAGKQKEIIVDYIELGRDHRCAIRYSEQDKTVSRRHAAISKEGDTWVLLNLSEVNPTLLNNRPVKKRYYLSSGDEIQLSVEGPKLGFIVPSNNKTGSLSIGKRMTLFGEQALKPYRRAIYGLVAALIVISALSGFFIYQLKDENVGLTEQNLELENTLIEQDSLSTQKENELLAQIEQDSVNSAKQIANLQRRLRTANSRRPRASSSSSSGNTSANVPTDLNKVYADVYSIKAMNLKVTQNNGEIIQPENFIWFGTGFLTQDNRFITARHVIEPWFFPIDKEEDTDMFLINVLINNYGAKIDLEFEATSSSGKKLKFTLDDFKIDRSGDKAVEVTIEGGPHVVRHALESPNDIAFAKINQKGSIITKPDASTNLQAATQLYVLGYPLRFGSSPGNMSPIYSTATVGRAGLENNSIITSDRNFDNGSSGGPVFFKEGNGYYVIGVVSGGWGDNLGRIVPIKSVY